MMKTATNLEGAIKLTLTLISGVDNIKINPFIKFSERISNLTVKQRIVLENTIVDVLKNYNDMKDAQVYNEDLAAEIYPKLRESVVIFNHQLEFYLRALPLIYNTHIDIIPFNAN